MTIIIIKIIIIIIQKSVVSLLDSWALRAFDQNNILVLKKFIVMPIKPERYRGILTLCTFAQPLFTWTIITISAVFKWMWKVMMWLRLLYLVISLKDLRQFFNQWESKPKSTAPCTRYFSRTLSELQVIAGNCDWFIALPAPVVIGRSNCFGFGFSTVIWKPL